MTTALAQQTSNYRAVRDRLFNPKNAVAQAPVRSTVVTLDAIDRKHKAVVDELQQRITSLTKTVGENEIVINKLQLDLADAQARILAQAEMLSKFDPSGDPEVMPVEPKRPVGEIIAEVLRDFPDVTWADIQSIRRTRHLVRPRQLCVYAVYKQRPDLSLPTIGRLFGGRDHTTILHSVQKVRAEREKDRA